MRFITLARVGLEPLTLGIASEPGQDPSPSDTDLFTELFSRLVAEVEAPPLPFSLSRLLLDEDRRTSRLPLPDSRRTSWLSLPPPTELSRELEDTEDALEPRFESLVRMSWNK